MELKKLWACRQFRLKTTQVFIIVSNLSLVLIVTVFCVALLVRYEVDNEVANVDSIPYWDDGVALEQQMWYDSGIEELKIALNTHYQHQKARNVILFLTSGVEPELLAALRFAGSANQKTSTQTQAPKMMWDVLSHVARLKNTCSSTNLCDLSTIATALLGGVRTNYKVSGWDATMAYGNCTETGSNEAHHVKSILQQAVEHGLRTGIVTNKRVTGAIAAALYAHTADTSWECDAAMPAELYERAGCLDVATQLMATSTGQAINVILGGGRQTLVSNTPQTPLDVVEDAACISNDSRNYLWEWQHLKMLQHKKYAFLENVKDVENLNGSLVDYVLGVFANDDLIDKTRINTMKQMPKQKDLVRLALETLQRKEHGYLLVVETSMEPDMELERKFDILMTLNDTIGYVLNGTKSDQTLIIAAFTNGNYRQNSHDSNAEELEQQHLDYDEWLDKRVAEIPGDTLVFAKGPKAFLFHGVHEETYMAHVIAYALKMGHFV